MIKKVILLALVLFSSLIIVGCKGKEKSSDKPVSKTNTKTLVLEFFSKGRGIDQESRILLDSMIAQKTELDCEFSQSLKKHGREGERKYCFTFPDNRCYNKSFGILDAKFGSKELIRIIPNGSCEK